MSKITFRADDELIEGLEALDASKSAAMREALRAYLDAPARDAGGNEGDSLDTLVAERVDAIIDERLEAFARQEPQDVNVNITLDGDSVVSSDASTPERKTPSEEAVEASDAARKTCGQCGEKLDSDHVYCPNCGEKAARRAFCDCGDELRSDWAFCPGCGRRTPAADVLDRS